jgi:hypothetical protein
MSLTATDVRALRIRALLLDAPAAPRAVAQIVEWHGAMQAQDLGSALWSLGSRIPGSTQQDITNALERKEALRTWPMRGTVHLVPPRDAAWLVRILGERPLRDGVGRRAYLGLDEADANKAVTALADALTGGGRLTRAQCVEVFAGTGLEMAGQLGYHLLWYASQLGVTCVAPNVDGEQTFVLLDEWVDDPVTPDRDEALGIIAERYFRSHGPALLKDFVRWTGLTVKDARLGVAVAGDALVEVTTDAGPMLASADVLGGSPSDTAGSVELPEWLVLAGFDEYMLGYGERSAFMEPGHLAVVVPGKNGVFRSTLVRDGRVAGVWTRKLRAKSCLVEVTDLASLKVRERKAAEAAWKAYGTFVGLPVEVRWR